MMIQQLQKHHIFMKNMKDESLSADKEAYPIIICVMGTSGTGKTSLAKKAAEILNYGRVVTTTTREIRQGEKDGEDYHFVSRKELMKADFVECDMYHGNIYGTRISDIQNALKNHDCAFEVITWNGYQNISEYYKTIPIVVENRNFHAIRERMEKRGDSAYNIDERMRGIQAEADFLHEQNVFHYDNSKDFDPEKFSECVKNTVILERSYSKCFDFLPEEMNNNQRNVFLNLVHVFGTAMSKGQIEPVIDFCSKYSGNIVCDKIAEYLNKETGKLKNVRTEKRKEMIKEI